jgi:hypothetical protein
MSSKQSVHLLELLFDAENGDGTSFQNAIRLLADHTASHQKIFA